MTTSFFYAAISSGLSLHGSCACCYKHRVPLCNFPSCVWKMLLPCNLPMLALKVFLMFFSHNPSSLSVRRCITDFPFSGELSAIHYSLEQLWDSVLTTCHLFRKEACLMRFERCTELWFHNKSPGIRVGLLLSLLNRVEGYLLGSMTYLATSSWSGHGARYGLCFVEQN